MSAPVRSILDVLEEAVGNDPDREALVDRSGRLTYAELWRRVTRLGSRLEAAGIRPGDRVAVCLPNENAAVVSFLAVVAVGGVWVGLNPSVPVPERQKLLDAASVTAVLSRDDLADGLAVPGFSVLDVGDLAPAGEPASLGTARPGAESPAVVAFTSGTTGQPRAIVHSHWNLLLPGHYRAATDQLGRRPRMGVCLPLSIANVMALGPLFTVQARTACVVLDTRRAVEISARIAEEAVTTISIPPAIVLDLVRDPAVPAERLRSVTHPSTGGAGCSDDLKAEFRAKFGVDIVRTYGLTELPTVAAIERWDEPAPPGGSGRLLPYLAATTVDASGSPLPRGQVGEIWLFAATQGEWAGYYRLLLGEWENGGLRANPGGPLRTGDIGYLDEEDTVFVVDRKKSIINRGGANVSPAEVEKVLLQHPATRQCVVLGIPDVRLGERVVALVASPDRDPVELAGFCRERLAAYKVPGEILYVDALPLNAMEKVDQVASRALFAQLRAAEDTGGRG